MKRITDEKTGLYLDVMSNEDVGVYWSYQSNKHPSEKFIIWEIEDYDDSNKHEYKCVMYLNTYIDNHGLVMNTLKNWFYTLKYAYGTEGKTAAIPIWAHLNEDELDSFEKVLGGF